MKMTKAQEDFLGICWKMKVVNIIPQAAKLGIPEDEVRKYLATKGLAIEQGGFVFQGTGKPDPLRGLVGIAVEFFKLDMMDHYWGKYHCVHSLAPAVAWEMRRDQRVKLEQAIQKAAWELGLTKDHPEIKAAKEAYLSALEWTDAPEGPRKGKSKKVRSQDPTPPGNAAKGKQ